MFVSFLVATYNCADRVHVLLNTARSLSEFPCEFLISDGASQDGTLRMLEGHPNVRISRSSPDLGIYDAWNQGLNACQGEYISFLGVDDKPGYDFLKAALLEFELGAQPAFIYGDSVLSSNNLFRKLSSPKSPKLFESDRPLFDIPHPGSLNHRSLFDKNRFDPTFRLAGDLDFYIRIRDQIKHRGYLCIPQIQAIIDAHGISRSAKAYRLYREEFERIEKTLGLELHYSSRRLNLLSSFKRYPKLFDALRSLAWNIRGQRHVG